MTETETPRTDFSVAPMTVDLLPSVIELEEACSLNSRGLEGYRKMLSNPQSVLLVALAPSSPISAIGPISVLGVFSGEVVVESFELHEGDGRHAVLRLAERAAQIEIADLPEQFPVIRLAPTE